VKEIARHGELEPRRAEAYRQHLASCPACRLSLEEHSLVVESLRWGGEEAPPDDLRRALLEEFRRVHPATGPVVKAVSWISILERSLREPVRGAAALFLAVLGLIDPARGDTAGPLPLHFIGRPGAMTPFAVYHGCSSGRR
jgi:anti-sigma factor RsiW